MKAIRWVQQDWLRAPAGPPAVYVFDTETIAGYSLKRIQFIYECLLEIPVEIRLGTYEEQVAEFARQHGAGAILTTFTPDPRAAAALERLQRDFHIHVEETEPFIPLSREPDFKRFSRYWSRVEPLLLGPPRRSRP